MSEIKTLNPILFRRILRHFGDVRITHPGEARLGEMRRDVEGEPKMVIKQWGEQYLVRCTVCRAPFQLSISYMYGQRDESGRPLAYLVHCFARNCMAQYQNRAAFAKLLGADDGILEEARIFSGKTLTPEDRVITLPDGIAPVDRLPKGHPARRYLRANGMDPDRVGKRYDLHFGAWTNDVLVKDRIIFPVRHGDELRGWQSLSVTPAGETDRSPKYLSAPGMQSGSLIYNLANAKSYQTLILVAEPLHVWLFGAMALCPLGSGELSDQQRRLLRSACRNKSVVALLSAAELEGDGGLIAKLERRMLRRFTAVTFPMKLPPAPEVRAYLRTLVTKKAKKQGVDVTYKKCPA